MKRALSTALGAIAVALALPAAAQAYQVHVSIAGAGQVTETTSADLVGANCLSPATTPTGTVAKDCYPGSVGSGYGWGWTVRYVAAPDTGYRFDRWESDGGSDPVLCDNANNSSTYTGTACQFATYKNLQTRAVFVDDTKPAAPSLSGPSQPANGSRTFSFSTTSDPTFRRFECRVVNVHDWTPCSTGQPEDPPTGSYTFDVRARDWSDNLSDVSSWNWTVDKIAPQGSLGSAGPSGLVNTRAASFEFSSNEQGDFICQLDSQAQVVPCGSPQSFSGLADGPHSFKVWARDAAGNVDATPAVRDWTVDATPPDAVLGSSGPSGSTTAKTATFGFYSEDGATFSCQLDGQAIETPCSSPRTYGGLALGQHTFRVWAHDAAQNTDPSPATRTWTVVATPDTTAPQTTITGGPGQDSSTESTTASLEFSSDEAGTFECRLDGAAFAPCTSPAALTGLAVGSHTFAVRARDTAGNLDASPAQRSWVVTAPYVPPYVPPVVVPSAVVPPVVDPAAAPFLPLVSSKYALVKKKTRFTVLALANVPPDAKVVLTCKGKGCPLKSKAVPHKKASVPLLKLLAHRLLGGGAVLQVRITSAAGAVKVGTWKIRGGKLPLFGVRCAAPGGTLGKCY